MGGTHHPLLGVFGVMSAKMTVANLMILVTFMSFIMYWRAGKEETAGWAKIAKAVMSGVLVIAGIVVIVLGVWGYFVPAIIRINYFSVAQVLIVLFVMLTITPLTALLLRSAKTTTEMVWGRMPPRAGYALVLNAGGHFADDPHGLRAVFVKSALAHLWRHAGFLSICLFSGPRVCRRVDVSEYLPLLHAGRLYFLGCHHGRQGQAERPHGRQEESSRGAYPAMAGGSPSLDEHK